MSHKSKGPSTQGRAVEVPRHSRGHQHEEPSLQQIDLKSGKIIYDGFEPTNTGEHGAPNHQIGVRQEHAKPKVTKVQNASSERFSRGGKAKLSENGAASDHLGRHLK